MNTSERIKAVLNFEKPDRFPALEWGCWWYPTIERWQSEGLDTKLANVRWYVPGIELTPENGDIGDAVGLDPFRILWLALEKPGCPQPAGEGKGIVTNMEEYLNLRKWLFPDEPFEKSYLEQLRDYRRKNDMAVWMFIDGFFWAPRKLLGIENHLFAFYDQPDLLKLMNEDLLAWYKKILPWIFEYVVPDVFFISEDLSYNHGPMISQECFEEFLTPFYRELTSLLKPFGIHAFMDSDGDIMPIIPWLLDAGIEGLGPLERMAGVDIVRLREQYPDFRLVGAFDKMLMHKGEEAMRTEFERIFPVIRQGGYLPTVDHQTPPDVSLEQYHCFRRLFREYTDKAML